MKRIVDLGSNTFARLGTNKFIEQIGGEFEIEEAPTQDSIADWLELRKNNCDFGVFPYYNHLEGLVQESLDVIYERNLRILDATRIPIMFSIARFPETSRPKVVYSHPKALAQCSEYLSRMYPGLKRVPVENTGKGIEIVKQEKSGLAIGRPDVLEKELEVLDRDIGNKKKGRQNYTDFYLIAKDDEVEVFDDDKKYITMVAINPHFDKIGLLDDITSQLRYFGLNIAKIHSRPALNNGSGDPQMFYLEINCESYKKRFRKAIDSITWKLTPKGKDVEIVRVLGSYEKPTF